MSQILNYCFKSTKHCLGRRLHYFINLGPPLKSKAPVDETKGGLAPPPCQKSVQKPGGRGDGRNP